MSFEVTANRKRPSDFSGLIGQEFLVSTLTKSIESGKTAHAFLFAGPRGVGKTSAARILARALNANDHDDPIAAEEISKGTSVDVIEIDGASHTSVNDIRGIKDELLFPPQYNKYKIYIIDEVHMLSNSAFNALLKTIEEPPPYVVFIFATTELHKVPATIKSRCQQFTFRLIPSQLIVNQLAAVCNEMGYEYEEGALAWIAKEATGSMRDAYTLFDQVVAFSQGSLKLSTIQDKLGLISFELRLALLKSMGRGQTSECLELVSEAMDKGTSVEQFIVDFAELLRAVLLIRNGVTRPALTGVVVDGTVEELVAELKPDFIHHALDQLFQLHRDIRFSINQRYELELCITRLCTYENLIHTSEAIRELKGSIKKVIEAAYGQAGHGPSEEGAKEPKGQQESIAKPSEKAQEPSSSHTQSEIVDAQKVEGSEVRDRFKLLIQKTKQKVLLSSALSSGVEHRVEGSTLHLDIPHSFHYETIKKDHRFLTGVASSIWSVDKISLHLIENKEEENKASEAEDPSLQLVKDVFRGEVVDYKASDEGSTE